MMDVDGPWSEELTSTWREWGPSVGLMYRGPDGGALSFLPELEGLRLLAVSGNIDDSAIERCATLERVVLMSTATTPLDWGGLQALARLDMQDRPGIETLERLGQLRSLYLWDCKERDFTILGRLHSLEELALKPSRRLESLRGAEGLARLRRLELNHCRQPIDLAGLGQMRALRQLELGGCRKQGRLDGIEQCSWLKELSLGDCSRIDSLERLGACRDLEALSLYGSTNVIDGDLSVLDRLPLLTRVDFSDRRHYNRRSKDYI